MYRSEVDSWCLLPQSVSHGTLSSSVGLDWLTSKLHGLPGSVTHTPFLPALDYICVPPYDMVSRDPNSGLNCSLD